MPPSSSSRRKALVAITGATAVLPVLAQQQPSTSLSKADFDLLNSLTDHIIPRTGTPGAADAGVARIIDQGLAKDKVRRERWQTALQWFRANTKGDEVAMLKRISSEKDTEGARHFALLKGETIDIYYSTIEGLKTELGWNANTYLPEFKGCTHPEHQS